MYGKEPTIKEQLADVENLTGKPRRFSWGTVVYTVPGETRFRYRQTDIVRKLDGSKIVLNTGGWYTKTTKEKMNQALSTLDCDFQIYQHGGLWYVSSRSLNKTVLFKDEMVLPDDFNTANPDDKKEKQKLIKAISRLCSKITKDNLPKPSNGDCWYCLMTVNGTDETLGDATNNKEHLLSHIEEGYLHGSLLVNAMRWAGYDNIGINYSLQTVSTFKSALRRYLKAKLGLPR